MLYAVRFASHRRVYAHDGVDVNKRAERMDFISFCLHTPRRSQLRRAKALDVLCVRVCVCTEEVRAFRNAISTLSFRFGSAFCGFRFLFIFVFSSCVFSGAEGGGWICVCIVFHRLCVSTMRFINSASVQTQ